MTMLVMWLIELYLNDLGSLKEELVASKREDLQDEFRKFLAQTKVKVITGNKGKCWGRQERYRLILRRFHLQTAKEEIVQLLDSDDLIWAELLLGNNGKTFFFLRLIKYHFIKNLVFEGATKYQRSQ